MATTFEEFVRNPIETEIDSFTNPYDPNDMRYNATALVKDALNTFSVNSPIQDKIYHLSLLLQYYNNFLARPNQFFENFQAAIFQFSFANTGIRNTHLQTIMNRLKSVASKQLGLDNDVKENAEIFSNYVQLKKPNKILFPFAVGFATQQTIPANATRMNANSFLFMPSGFESEGQYNPRVYEEKKQNIISAISVLRPVYFETNQAFDKDNLVAYCLDLQGKVQCILITGIKISVKSKDDCRGRGGEYIENLALTKKWNGTQYVNQPEWGVCIE